MLAQNAIQSSTLGMYGPRLAHMRRRDPYFGALCDNVEEVERQVAALSRTATGRPTCELHRLEQKRQNYLATIEFMLEDQTARAA